jgi:hypothetical protein
MCRTCRTFLAGRQPDYQLNLSNHLITVSIAGDKIFDPKFRTTFADRSNSLEPPGSSKNFANHFAADVGEPEVAAVLLSKWLKQDLIKDCKVTNSSGGKGSSRPYGGYRLTKKGMVQYLKESTRRGKAAGWPDREGNLRTWGFYLPHVADTGNASRFNNAGALPMILLRSIPRRFHRRRRILGESSLTCRVIGRFKTNHQGRMGSRGL